MQQADDPGLDDFLARWRASGASERANYQSYLKELCRVLDVPEPDAAGPDDDKNAYVFDRRVTFRDPLTGEASPRYIDLYKRGCFVLEAKQGSDRAEADPLLVGAKAGKRGTAVRGTRGWDRAMIEARGQAEGYARDLPPSEGWPAFLVVVDIGHTIETYADFSRMGKAYVPFPDALTHRIAHDDLARPEIRERLRLVWTDPQSLDPTRRTAKVTRQVAEKLARLAKSLEASGHPAEPVAQFLMRCLFTMFAEDVGILTKEEDGIRKKEGFTRLLKGRRGKVETFPKMVKSLWTAMDRGEYSPILEADVLRFNGQLFASADALPLNDAQLELLIEAAEAEWSDVEPAIFGTLLERALDPVERHKLGAHYTPRAYVERLVMPTIIEPLRAEWDDVRVAAVTAMDEGKADDARALVRDFLARLCDTRVLDPACGTGNFLYVTFEHMKRLEGEVRDTLKDLGELQASFEGMGRTVDPHQLLGIEINPRAAAIADLVLWIGYLQWHFRTFGATTPAEPVLHAYKNIECRDALLDYDRKEPALDADGQPITRWDGRTMKKHPVTGEDVPDESARVVQDRYVNPRKAEWPEAEYVVGNPPFIGNKRMRLMLGDGYVGTLRTVWNEVPEAVDFVMYWWKQAADLVTEHSIRNFGFITTNSITQSFNRRILQDSLGRGASITFAIPDHPWVDTADGAAVRVAMTVGTGTKVAGRLQRVVEESEGDGDALSVSFAEEAGSIHSDLKVGADVTEAKALLSNSKISFMGVTLVGQGFVVEPGDPLISIEPGSLRRYLVGNELNRIPKNRYVIDLFGKNSSEALAKYPAAFQRLLDRVKPERDTSERFTYRENWWLFGEKRPAMRAAIDGLQRYVAICRTAKHLIFQFIDSDILVESKVVAIASPDAMTLGVLSSKVHTIWATRTASRHGVGNDFTYNNSICFETFPFPCRGNRAAESVRQLAESLDAHRKRQQALHPSLTLTDMYNVLEKLRSGEALTAKDRTIHEQGLVSVLKQIHDDLDAAVFEAYGWPASLTDEEILERLVALNAERAEEESRGIVRWLRPEFQNPDGAKGPRATQETLAIVDEPEPAAKSGRKGKKPKAAPAAKAEWPSGLPEQAQAVRNALATEPDGATPETLAKRFVRARVDRVRSLLETLASLGQARKAADGRYLRA